MSTITYLTSLVQQAISRLNNYEANAKKVGELPHQTNLNTASKIPIDRAGISEYITVDQIASAIQNGNYNQLLAIGAVSVNELTNEITVASGVTAQINGSIYQTTTDTTIPITLCPAGFSRKDILVLTTSNTVIAISGEETDGAIVLAPPVPIDAIYITEFDVNDNAIGTPSDPILGAQFKQKIENTRWKSTQSGSEVVIPFQASGQSHYSVVHSGLISVAGFSTSLLTTPMYEGQDVYFENQTGNSIGLKNMFVGISTPFNLGADLIVPNNGKILFKCINGKLELFMKSWSEILGTETFEQSRWLFNDFATESSNLYPFIGGAVNGGDIFFNLTIGDSFLKHKQTIRSGASANGGYRVQTNGNTSNPFFSQTGLCFFGIFRIDSRSDARDRAVRMGYHNVINQATPSQGAYLEIIGNTATFKVVNSSVETTSASFVLSSSTEALGYKVLIEWISNTSVRCKLVDTSNILIFDITHTTNVPATNKRFNCGVVATNTISGTSVEILQLDYMGFGHSKPNFLNSF